MGDSSVWPSCCLDSTAMLYVPARTLAARCGRPLPDSSSSWLPPDSDSSWLLPTTMIEPPSASLVPESPAGAYAGPVPPVLEPPEEGPVPLAPEPSEDVCVGSALLVPEPSEAVCVGSAPLVPEPSEGVCVGPVPRLAWRFACFRCCIRCMRVVAAGS